MPGIADHEVLGEVGTVFDGLLSELLGLLHRRVRADDGRHVVRGLIFRVDVLDADHGRIAVVRIAGSSRGVVLSEALVSDCSSDMGASDCEPVSFAVVGAGDQLVVFEVET